MRRGRRFLIAASESEEERETRQASVGKSAGESYAATLRQLVPGCTADIRYPVEPEAAEMPDGELAGYDAVFLSGSPIHIYRETPGTRRVLGFMDRVFASGVPSFGSCAGLQVAVVAAGGTVRKMTPQREAGVARRIAATAQGRDHPFLAGRAAVWDALTIHGDEVADLPPGATLLATSGTVRVQAVEIRHGAGTFWGVQYHPELAPGEIAAALRRGAEGLVGDGLAGSIDQVEHQAAALDMLQRDPNSLPARWELGIDDDVAIEAQRRSELLNFIRHFGVG